MSEGGGDDIPAAIAHGCLAIMAAYGIGNNWTSRYNCPGMHGNFLVHGVLGVINWSKSALSLDLAKVMPVTMAATRYLAIPFVMADINRFRSEEISIVHLASGIIPFAVMAFGGKGSHPIADICLALNIGAMAYHAFDHNANYAYAATGLAILAYFVVPVIGDQAKVLYPVALSGLEWCVFRCEGFANVG